MALNKQKLKEKLESEEKVLLAQLGDIAKQNPKTGEWEATPEAMDYRESDQNDMADRFEDFESRGSTMDVLQQRLKSIQDALKALSKSTFGQCKICKKEIEMARLEANPAARTCKKHIKEN